ncbi:MAG: membrane dipeptidase [Calditrichaeota bacterium]|nr:membrane dipeptidase [Calditrichota bacterium]MCB0294302.1 membrane dipeptidase [Calditrichota bacterium]MCB0304068.1 membrane dipeptidase [Calditrichota bacterium]
MAGLRNWLILPALAAAALLAALVGGASLQQAEEKGIGFADLHNSVLRPLFDGGDFSRLARPEFPVSLPGIRAAGTRVLFCSLGVPRFSLAHPDTVRLADVLAFFRHFSAEVPRRYPELAVVGNGRELREARVAGKTALFLALEGTHLLRGDPAVVDSLYAAGVRMIGIAHRFQNAFFEAPPGAGEHAPPLLPALPLGPHTRLSPAGRALLERMIEKGMLIDLSHLGEAAFWEVVELNAGRTPLIASHVNARALCDTSRNLSDAQLQAIARSGGLVGVSFHSPLLTRRAPRAEVADVADHIIYIDNLIGPAHVAVGSDWEGRILPPQGLEKIERIPALTAELRRRGMKDSLIGRVMGGNVLRILERW